MGIRRRRRRLTTLMSRLDQRVRSVELRPINLLTSSDIDNAITIAPPATGPETVVSSSAPYQFKKVHDGYVYSNSVTGKGDRVELYFEAELGAAAGDRIEVSGIHWGSSTAIDVDGDNFTVESVETPPWADRPSYRHDPTQDQLSGVTISHSYYFKPDSSVPSSWSSKRRLQTRRKVDSFEISAAPNSTVTLTMNATHHFEVGDIIFVDIFSESSAAYGSDGLFEITAVTGTTIEYVLAAGVDVAVSSTDVSSSSVYVFPVARQWAQDGSIWVDSSSNETYYWDGIRWVEYTPGAVAGDGNPPAAPTNLDITSNIDFIVGNTARVIVEVGWSAPTTNADGSALTDLFGYLIKWRAGSGDWKTYRLEDATATSVTFGEAGLFADNTAYSFEVYAFDSGGEYSAALTGNHTTADAPDTNIATVRPTPFTPSVYLGTITLVWDGDVENTSGVTQTKPDGLVYLDIHRSITDGFTPSTSTLVTSITAVAGAKYVDASVTYGNSYYYRAILRDASNTSSLPSEQVTGQATSLVDVAAIQGIIQAANITPGTIVTGEEIIGLNITGQLIRGDEINGNIIKANSIEANKIDVGALAAQFLSSDVIATNSTDSGSRVRITTSGLEAYNGSTRTIFINSTDGSIQIASGSITIGGSAPATQGDLSSFLTSSDLNGYLTSAVAANTYAELSDLGLYITASDASNTYITAVTANGLYISQSDNAGDYVTSISGNTITTGTISADRIGAGTFVGSSFKTADGTAKRILISGSSNSIKAYESGDSDGNHRGVIEGTSAGLIMSGRGSSPPRITLGGTSVILESPDTNDYITCGNAGLVLRGDDGSGWSEIDIDSNIEFDSSGAVTPEYYFRGTTNIVRVEDLSGSTISDVGTTTLGTLYRSSSDARLKENIQDSPLGLSFINALRPVTFDWKIQELGTDKNYGLIAQEVATALAAHGGESSSNILYRQGPSKMFSDYVTEEEPAYGLQYQAFVPTLIKAIQELSNTISTLESRIATLESN